LAIECAAFEVALNRIQPTGGRNGHSQGERSSSPKPGSDLERYGGLHGRRDERISYVPLLDRHGGSDKPFGIVNTSNSFSLCSASAACELHSEAHCEVPLPAGIGGDGAPNARAEASTVAPRAVLAARAACCSASTLEDQLGKSTTREASKWRFSFA
jgi:hypothetical protein